jgi:hypothetical protein
MVGEDEPLFAVDWPSTMRAELETSMQSGLGVVSLRPGERLKVLPGCTARASYRSVTLSPKHDVVELATHEQISAALPFSALGLTGKVGAGHEIAVKLGQFFLPASRENVEELWTSPYTLTLSALNSWVAEEIRPIGLDLAWSRTDVREQRWSLAASLFGGNDTAGTLVAWRGFALHDRPTPTAEFLPLPPLAVLATTFAGQDERGTRPFSGDLDGRLGYAGRARWDAPGRRAVVQATAFLNHGDRALHAGQYAWRTDFRWLSTEVELPGGLRLLGEWGTGTSAMGFAPPGQRSSSVVDIGFDVLYAMLSWQRGAVRTSTSGAPMTALMPEPSRARARPLTTWSARRVMVTKAWSRAISPPTAIATLRPIHGLPVRKATR